MFFSKNINFSWFSRFFAFFHNFSLFCRFFTFFHHFLLFLSKISKNCQKSSKSSFLGVSKKHPKMVKKGPKTHFSPIFWRFWKMAIFGMRGLGKNFGSNGKMPFSLVGGHGFFQFWPLFLTLLQFLVGPRSFFDPPFLGGSKRVKNGQKWPFLDPPSGGVIFGHFCTFYKNTKNH